MELDQKRKQKYVTVLVVTPVESVQLLYATLNYFPSIQAKWVTYSTYEEALALTDQITRQENLDAVMIVEFCVYQDVMDNLQLRLPVHFVTATGNNLYRSLFLLREQGMEHLICEHLPLVPLGDTLADLQVTGVSIHLIPDGLTTGELIREHRKYLQMKAYSGSLTTRLGVAKELKKEGFHCEWIEPTKQDMMVSLERTLLSTSARREMEKEIVVGLVEWQGDMAPDKTADLNRQIEDFARQLQSFCQPIADKTRLFVTSRGVFERVTRGYKSIPFVRQMEEPGLVLSVGAGFGHSSDEAMEHAGIALDQAMARGGNSCYLVKGDKQVVGPVAMTKHLVYDLSVTDPVILSKAKKSGMTGSYMSKLIAEVNREGTYTYTAQELAHLLGITLRSIHRNLQKWLDAELVHIIGQEKIYHSGRPRTMYEFKWLKEMRDLHRN